MTKPFASRWRILAVAFAAQVAATVSVPAPVSAQGWLDAMPRAARYREMAAQIPRSIVSAAIDPEWADDGGSFLYELGGQRYRYDVAKRQAQPIEARQEERGRRRGPERGRQYEEALSPDSTRLAFYQGRNLWVGDPDRGNARQLTTDGSEEARIKNGSASWVYGEELNQITAMWWSPDGTRLAWYRFDESPVPDYYLQLDQAELQSSLDIEAYPKAGVDNPIVQLFVHDFRTGTTVEIDARDGRPFTDDVVGHYVYRIGWTPDGSEITLNRTNRRQNIMEFTACDPATGKCRVVVREEWPASWTANSPQMRWLEDGRRFIWASERTGFRNLYLYDISGELLATLTDHPFEVVGVERVDEDAGVVWYTARSGDNHMKVQLHRVRLDGSRDERLTDPTLHHTISIAPDGRHFVDVAQTHDTPPVAVLRDARGREVARIADTGVSDYERLGLRPVEMFTYTSADGVTELHGMLHRPSDFDSTLAYPVLLSVYGGPATNGARESFTLPHVFTELGFLVVTLDARSAGGRGKEFLDAIYERLGVVEIDDMAAAVRQLRERPYVDGQRVGIYGTSYGGYASLMALLRHPDAFQAASASSPVTDWKHYDTIYTERYMYKPQENPDGYRAGSAITYADSLRGRLMIYYGTADNNVHPSNTMELIRALQQAGKSFDVQVGPDRGHTALNTDRMLEFFIDALGNEARAPAATDGAER